MKSEDLLLGVQTVVQLADFFDELKQAAKDFFENSPQEQRGHLTPHEEEEIRSLQASYWNSRSALLELISSYRRQTYSDQEHQGKIFLVAFAAATILVDVARLLRELVGPRPVVRRKLNEAAPEFGIPSGSYEQVQRSLTGARHAWHLYHALTYYQQNEIQLRRLAIGNEFAEVMEIIDQLSHRLDISLARYTQTRLRVRARQAMRKITHGQLARALYGLQKMGMAMMSDVYIRPGHQPEMPANILQQFRQILIPGDVLMVRKNYALTNYFLPGYWPHAALYLGDVEELKQLGLLEHQTIKSRWHLLNHTQDSSSHRVLESMKDGVHIRSLDSPLECDSLVVLRPHLSLQQIADGIARGMAHEGKPYDFGFDFSRSDRIVCTEVIYRAYDGLGPISFPLTRRAGRLTLSGSDLIRMAIKRKHFDPVAVFAPMFAKSIVSGKSACELLQTAISQDHLSESEPS